MTNSIRLAYFSIVTVVLLAAPTATVAVIPCPCTALNRAGTVDLMPTSCEIGYLGTMQIKDGLPAGDVINCIAELKDFTNTTENPGGSLGGNIQTWNATLELTMTGFGSIAPFNRFVLVQVLGITHTAPRTPGDAVQTFSHELVSLSGQIFGDPDFCTFEVLAGDAQALPPSPGSTTLTRLGPAGSDFQVDSFFDITYTIEFVGCPGSKLDGLSGISEGTSRFELCTGTVSVEDSSWGSLKVLYK